MILHDPDYPKYHMVAPEGWINDPNGVTWDPKTGLYHRFYQYDKTFNESCMHGVTKDCKAYGFNGQNLNARAWGHTVSKDLAHWQDRLDIDP